MTSARVIVLPVYQDFMVLTVRCSVQRFAKTKGVTSPQVTVWTAYRGTRVLHVVKVGCYTCLKSLSIILFV